MRGLLDAFHTASQRTSFALVVSDVEMPRLDGIGLCERLRADGRTARIPTAAASASCSRTSWGTR